VVVEKILNDQIIKCYTVITFSLLIKLLEFVT